MTDIAAPRSANGIGLSRLRLFSSIILLRLSLRQRISFSVVPSLFFICPRLAMLCKGEYCDEPENVQEEPSVRSLIGDATT